MLMLLSSPFEFAHHWALSPYTFAGISDFAISVVAQEVSTLLESHVGISECNYVLACVLTLVCEFGRTVAAIEGVADQVHELLVLLKLLRVHRVSAF